jgi:hypothetical protein
VRPLGPYKPETRDKFVLLDELIAELDALDAATPECEHLAAAGGTGVSPASEAADS